MLAFFAPAGYVLVLPTVIARSEATKQSSPSRQTSQTAAKRRPSANPKKFTPGNGYTKADWNAVTSPPLTDAELASMRPFAEIFPALAASIKRQKSTKP